MSLSLWLSRVARSHCVLALRLGLWLSLHIVASLSLHVFKLIVHFLLERACGLGRYTSLNLLVGALNDLPVFVKEVGSLSV